MKKIDYYQYEPLPKPFTDKENKECFIKMQTDPKYRNIIIEHNLALVVYVYKKHFPGYKYDSSILISAGNEALIKAVNSFDVNSNNSFSTYAIKCIKNEMLMVVRKFGKEAKRLISLEESIYVGENNTLKDFLTDDLDIEEKLVEKDLKTVVLRIVENLDLKDREILLMAYGFYDDKVYTQQEIAKYFDVSQPTIYRSIKQSINLIRKQLTKQPLFDKYKKKMK